MTFYVEKRLPLGPISFGVTPSPNGSGPDDNSLSTGPTGEFIRRGNGFFFGGHDRFAAPSVPEVPNVSSTPFWSALDSRFIALMAFGAFLALLGFAVIVRKGPQGWLEVILGAAMIATPIVLTARERRRLRQQEEWARAEREAIDRRNRELLASYTAVLEHARSERTQKAFARLAKKREALTLPYEVWAPTARRTVLLVGFDELAKHGLDAAREMMDRAAIAAGLSGDDRAGVARDFTHTVVWHLIADNRLGRINGFGNARDDARAIDQFRRVHDLATLPRINCSRKLEFHEYCIYETPTDRGTLHVTNRRLIIESKKPLEVPIARAFDVIANPDESVVTIKTENRKKPLRLRVEEPIYTAAILDAAASIDERPRGFA